MLENLIQTIIWNSLFDIWSSRGRSFFDLILRILLKETSLQGYRGLISAANSRQIETCQYSSRDNHLLITNRFRQLHFITDYPIPRPNLSSTSNLIVEIFLLETLLETLLHLLPIICPVILVPRLWSWRFRWPPKGGKAGREESRVEVEGR